mmetsp:Transcript_24394/g.63357  ORF Transcript_24394/g.63357 Transcript_24394/m.63357 type:complete len:256 (+) Transcript_24394:226-993(+)
MFPALLAALAPTRGGHCHDWLQVATSSAAPTPEPSSTWTIWMRSKASRPRTSCRASPSCVRKPVYFSYREPSTATVKDGALPFEPSISMRRSIARMPAAEIRAARRPAAWHTATTAASSARLSAAPPVERNRPSFSRTSAAVASGLSLSSMRLTAQVGRLNGTRSSKGQRPPLHSSPRRARLSSPRRATSPMLRPDISFSNICMPGLRLAASSALSSGSSATRRVVKSDHSVLMAMLREGTAFAPSLATLAWLSM